jgi:hypothetical protein
LPLASKELSKLPTITVYVPVTLATASIWAASAPDCDPRFWPVGLFSRIHGMNGESAPTSPMASMMASPAVALKLHISTSPIWMLPVWLPPLVRGPPSSPAEIANAPGAFASVKV